MYTGDGVGGKLVGLGQSDNEVIFAWAAAAPCDDLDFGCVGETEFNNLSGCFQGVPPPGVSRATFDRWCRKARQCGLFDKPGCEPEMSALVTERFGPIQDCQPVDMHEVFSYCDEYGYGGPDDVVNTLCWTAHLSPNRTRQQRRRPSCEDAECLTARDVAVMANCFMGDCPMPSAWFQRMREKPMCPGLLGPPADFQLPECLDADQYALMQYCETHGYQGPDGASNAACWTMQRSGVYKDIASLPTCASVERIRQRLERARERRRAEAEAPPALAPEPAAPTVTAPLEPPPVYTAAPEPGFGPPAVLEPEAEPERKVSMTTVGILAGVGVLAVGGILWAASKGKG